MMSEKPLSIGQLAKLAGINVETIRFYQKRGLIQLPPKPEIGYRIYSQEAVSRLIFIQQAKQVGFTLTEIQELLGLDDSCNCKEAKLMAQQKLTLTNEKLNELLRIKETLETYIDNCEQNNPSDKCPILQSLKKN